MNDSEYRKELQPWVEAMIDTWLDLREKLDDRPGWYFAADGAHAGWCFGQEGEARLVALPQDQDVRLYIHDEDETRLFMSAELMVTKLPPYEEKYAGLSAIGEAMKDAVIKHAVDQWIDESRGDEAAT